MKRSTPFLIIVWSIAAASACVMREKPDMNTAPPLVTTPSPSDPTRAWALTVVSRRTGAPIAGAEVSVRLAWASDSQRPCVVANCVTNADGYLLYPALTLGHAVQVHVAAAGFKSEVLSVDLAADTPDGRVTLEPFVLVPPTPRLRVEGTRFFTPDGKEFRKKFASDLSLLRRSPAERDVQFAQWASLGFNGIRLFGGDLPWANQSPMLARAELPGLLEQAARYGLYVQISAVTGASAGFDVAEHLRAVLAIAERYPNALIEGANEAGHPTQSAVVNDYAGFCALLRDLFKSTEVPWALGAILGVDEPDPSGFYPGACGPFSTAHLDRGRDLLNQGRRVREIYEIKQVTGRPADNAEPLGFAEFEQPGRRTNQPWFAFMLSVLNRLFGVGGVFHSEAGLNSYPFGADNPRQLDAARQFIAAANVIPTDEPLQYWNVGQGGSPVKSAQFVEEGGPIVRCYAFVSADGRRAYLAVFHAPEQLTDANAFELRDGWRIAGALPGAPHVSLFRVER